ncbi:uncharacterized protein B0T15DRAFT_3714 [Chaetomium strumarium]|uniref:Cell wall protein n=1 Tax=Chaetomium strumarium TaxID=1170767 RepID=A0AAJ0H0A2_9PEZI|nr:hypothetical protein B0T15DRAFT_3714 [Chaetomium strumarium]
MHYPAALVALAALVAPSAASPNGWSSPKSAPDGPTKLDDCGCWPIYQAMLKCQKLKGPNSNIDDCVCIPNPDGWYTSLNGCRACLSPGSYDDNDFFDNLSRTISQLFVSCTNVGGGINSPDGESICASNYYFQACASLRTDGQPSWASYEVFKDGTGGNGTYVLDIAEYGASSSAASSATTDTATSTTATTSGSTTATGATTTDSTTGGSETTGTSVASTSTTVVETTSAPAATTSSPSSAMGYAGSRSQAGRIVGLVFAVGVAVVLV